MSTKFKVGDRVRVKPEVHKRDYKEFYERWGVKSYKHIFRVEHVYENSNIDVKMPVCVERLTTESYLDYEHATPKLIIIIRR